MSETWEREGYLVTTDPAKMQLDAIHGYLSRAYWCEGIPRSTVERAVENSLCFAVLHGEEQVGFARVVTDTATFAYLCDVYVLEEHRGKGLSKWMMECVVGHPKLQGLRRFSLATRDAHGLYKQFGFHAIAKPELLMEILVADIYR
jgi:GNAT superfamily N-acetyltransferase